jgi:hypothetical protein
MRIPGFTAGMSLYRPGEPYGSEAKSARRNNIVNGDSVIPAPTLNSQVVPAQVLREPCLSIQGNCTPPSGGTSIANNHGFRQVCRGPSQVAWVEVCRWPSGTGLITGIDRGCAPCRLEPPPPPPPPPLPPPPPPPCGCPSSFPSCNILADGTSWCCPSSFPVVRRLPFFGLTCVAF